jgi:hypothetical protein
MERIKNEVQKMNKIIKESWKIEAAISGNESHAAFVLLTVFDNGISDIYRYADKVIALCVALDIPFDDFLTAVEAETQDDRRGAYTRSDAEESIRRGKIMVDMPTSIQEVEAEKIGIYGVVAR